MVNDRNAGFPRFNPPFLKALGIGLSVAAFLFLEALLLTQDSKLFDVLALILTVVPVAIYFGIKRPLLFPFALFLALVPFDTLLLVSRAGTLTKFLAILSGFAALVFLIRTKKAVPTSRSLLWWGVVAFWMTASVAWALDATLSWKYISTFLQLFSLYAIISMLPVTGKDLKVLLAAVVLGGTAAGAYGAYYFLHQPALLQERLFIANAETTVDPNLFGAALILPISLAVMSVLRMRRLGLKALYALPVAIMFGALLFTGSRGAILAVGVMFLYFFFRTPFRTQVGAVLATGIAMSFVVAPHIWTRFAQAGATGGAHRIPIWHIGFAAFQQHWLIGAGIGNFVTAYDQVFLKAATLFTQWSRAPHNLLLGTAAELGVVGLFFMLTAWFYQFKTVAHIKKGDAAYDLRVALEGSIIALFVASMFLDVIFTKFAWSTFLMLAILRSYTFTTGRRGDEKFVNRAIEHRAIHGKGY